MKNKNYALSGVVIFIIITLTACSGSSENRGNQNTVEIPGFVNVLRELSDAPLGTLGQTCAWGDYNGDNSLDIAVSNTDRRASANTFLLENQGNKFNNVTELSGITDRRLRSLSWADFNNDGFLDLATGTIRPSVPVHLYKNTDGKSFVDISEEAGIGQESAVIYHSIWTDYNLDGYVDLFLVNSGISFLYRNNGDETFENVTKEAGLENSYRSASAIIVDLNNDMFPDIFLANEGFNVHYKNNGDGTFSDVTSESGLQGEQNWDTVSACAGDYNSDGHTDLYIGNIASGRNALYKNSGDGTFTDVTEKTGAGDVGDARTCSFLDFDGDSRLDILTTNHLQPTKLYRNLGNDSFVDVATEAGLHGNPQRPIIDVFAASAGDFNNDGFIDLFFNGHIGIALFENQGNENRNIVIKLEGNGTTTNSSAINTKLELFSAGNGKQFREVSGGKGCCEQDMLPLHFGTGQDSQVDIDVKWTDGTSCSFEDIDISTNHFFAVKQEGCQLVQEQ